MKARVIITVHRVNVLDAVRLAELTQLLGVTFGVLPTVNTEENEMVVLTTTNDHTTLIRTLGCLVDELAQKYSPLLWVSMGSEWRQP